MVTIYSKDNCQYCLLIQKLCERKQITIQIKKLDVDFTSEELQTLTEGKARSYPQVFKGDEYIGDYHVAQKLISTGKL